LKENSFIVLFWLCLLYLISYLDRVAISVTAPQMMKEFSFSKTQMGLIFAAFAYPYALLQIVGGTLGDAYGPRRVLAIMMGWWSAFTTLTCMGWNLSSLLVIRALFGLGEAGGFPVATRAMATWFSPEARGNLQGITHAASRFGAAIAPPVAVALMLKFGWRSVFYILGAVGFAWTLGFFYFYRDNPSEHRKVSDAELEIIGGTRETVTKITSKRIPVPWRHIAKNSNLWRLVFADFCYGYSLWVYLTWLPTYLVASRGFSILKMGFFAALPLLGGMFGDLVGGYLSDRLYIKTGNLRLARCSITFIAFVGSIVFTIVGAFTANPYMAVYALTAAFFFLEGANANLWAIAMDLGGNYYSGTVSGMMNTGFGVAGMISPVVFGLIVDLSGSWVVPFVVSTSLLGIGSIVIATVNPAQSIIPVTMEQNRADEQPLQPTKKAFAASAGAGK
jgi:ACS family D-galactonate transporter-like MFS transporter